MLHDKIGSSRALAGAASNLRQHGRESLFGVLLAGLQTRTSQTFDAPTLSTPDLTAP